MMTTIMKKKYYVAPAIMVQKMELETLCAGSLNANATQGSFSDPVLDGDASEACGKLHINDVWE